MTGLTTESPATSPRARRPEELYLDLLKGCLTRYIFGEHLRPFRPPRGHLRRAIYAPVLKLLAGRGLTLAAPMTFDPEKCANGVVWPPPAEAETIVGLRRLDNLQECIVDVLRENVPGDLIETGAWRGGATIFMRAALEAYGDTTRSVWVADSFQGLPKPDVERYPKDADSEWWTYGFMEVSLDEVKRNFDRYGLLDDRVQFLVGWFRDTLPAAPIDKLAILRLDGDMYESTMDSLRNLYPKLSVGGYIMIDDYALAPCRAAVEDYRAEHGISERLQRIDTESVFWQRLS